MPLYVFLEIPAPFDIIYPQKGGAMKHTVTALAAIVLGVIFSVTEGFAGDSKFALSAKAGTLGIGLETAMNLNENFNARLGMNAFEYDYDGQESGIDYDFEFSLLTVAGLLDWFPFEQGFRITGGVMLNDNTVDFKATPTGSYNIGGVTYTAAEVGSLTGDIDFEDISPYLGVGWGNPFGTENSWSLNLDLGVMYQGTPEITYNTNGTLSNDPTFRANLERERQDVEDELDSFEFYPVFSIGISYRF